MKKFIGFIEKNRKLLFWGLLLAFDAKPMDVFQKAALFKAMELFPQKKFKCFDPAKMVEQGKPFSCIPKKIIIMPDEKGFLVGGRGIVSYVNFDALIAQNEPLELVKHSYAHGETMIAVAQKNDECHIVSVGNYKNEDGKRVAECIFFNNKIVPLSNHKDHNVFDKKLQEARLFKWPVQAVDLSANGEILALATTSEIHIFDLISNSMRTNLFKDRKNDSAVDVSLCSKEKKLALVGSQGVVDIKKIVESRDNTEFSSVKSVSTGSSIKRIYFLDSLDLVYETECGDIKTIFADDWLKNNGGEIANKRCFESDPLYDKMSFDQNKEYAVAHWTNNCKLLSHVPCKIKVDRQHNAAIEHFVLKMVDDFSATYPYITEDLRNGIGKSHFLTVALRGKRIVALFTDGYAYLWTLPEKYQAPNLDYIEASTSPFKKKDDSLLVSRSNSDPMIKGVARPKATPENELLKSKRSSQGRDKSKRTSKTITFGGGGSPRQKKKGTHTLFEAVNEGQEKDGQSELERWNSG